MSKEMDIRLEGLLVFPTIPTEDIYKGRFDISHLTLEQRENLIHELEDLYVEIDNEYSRRTTRERSFHVKRRHKNEISPTGRKVRVEKPELEFYLVPHRIANWMKKIRSLYYELLNKRGIKIPLMKWETEDAPYQNVRERNIYLIPKNMVSEFMREFNEINDIYRDIHALVMDFAYSPYLEKLNAILEKYDLPTVEISFFANRNPRATLRIMEMNMSAEVINRWAMDDPEVAKAIEEQTRQLVKSAAEQVGKEMQSLMERVLKNLKKWAEKGDAELRMKILDEIETVQRKANYLGMERVEVLDKVSAVLRGDIEFAEEEFEGAMDEIDERITSFVNAVEKAKIKHAIREMEKSGGLAL